MNLLALVLACAGSKSVETESRPAPAEDPAPEPTLTMKMPGSRAAPRGSHAAHATRFALDLHRVLRDGDGNAMSSGPSAMVAFSMLGLAAKGETLAELGSLMGAPVDEAWHIDNERLLAAWNDTRGVQLASANALWVDQGLTLAEPFVSSVGTHYGTAPATLPFRADADEAARVIDAWTQKQTLGMIDRLFPPADLRDVAVVLANAVAFKGTWQVRFDAENTRPTAFATPTGPTDVPTMHRSGRIRFTEGDGWTAVALPYDGESTSMLVVLPNRDVPLVRVEDGLDVDALVRISEGVPRDLDLALPRFGFALTHELPKPIAAMGAPTLFAGGDFSGMGIGPLGIDKAIQKVFVKVDEQGTEAAAVTAIAMKRSASAVQEKLTFKVDRPFLFAIWHHETRVPLFIGRVTDPR